MSGVFSKFSNVDTDTLEDVTVIQAWHAETMLSSFQIKARYVLLQQQLCDEHVQMKKYWH